MRSVEVYIKDNQEVWTRLDLFDYETIDITNSIQDVKEIGKVFTDFSKEFDVPASDNNNKVFKHYYNPDVQGFDARFKLDALIKIDGIDYRKGKISLLGANLHNYMAKSYQIVFYGETVALSDILGDYTLRDLRDTSISNYDFEFDKDVIMNGLESGYIHNGTSLATVSDDTYDLCFPFISASSFYFYDSDKDTVNPTDNVDSRNILMPPSDGASDIGTNLPRGVHFDDLKPALRVDKIVRGIEEKFGLNFSNNFFSSSNKPYYDLFLWLQRESGTLSDQIGFSEGEVDISTSYFTLSTGNEQRDNYFGETDLAYLETSKIGSSRNFIETAKRLSFTATMKSGGANASAIGSYIEVYADRDYYLGNNLSSSEKDILIDSFSFQADSSINIDIDFIPPQSTFNINGVKYVYKPRIKFVTLNTIDTVSITNVSVDERQRTWLSDYSVTDTGDYSNYDLSVSDSLVTGIVDYMPKIKIIDFLTGLFKMFNLTAYYDGSEIVIRTLDDYYQNGVQYDLTTYVDTSNTEVQRNNLYSQIDMMFAKASTFAAQNANEIQANLIKRDFGNEKLDNVHRDLGGDVYLAFDGGKYEIKAPFEKVMYERMLNQSSQTSTVFQWGWFCSKDENPVLGKPLLFYPIKTAGNYLFDKNVKGDDWSAWQSDAYGSNNYTEILNYYIRPSNSTDDYLYSLNFGSESDEYTLDENPNSLFTKFWYNYISNIYDRDSRIFTLSAFLPTHILVNLKLNDIVVIGNRKYRINKLEVNLNNGKAKLELFNDLGYYD